MAELFKSLIRGCIQPHLKYQPIVTVKSVTIELLREETDESGYPVGFVDIHKSLTSIDVSNLHPRDVNFIRCMDDIDNLNLFLRQIIMYVWGINKDLEGVPVDAVRTFIDLACPYLNGEFIDEFLACSYAYKDRICLIEGNLPLVLPLDVLDWGLEVTFQDLTNHEHFFTIWYKVLDVNKKKRMLWHTFCHDKEVGVFNALVSAYLTKADRDELNMFVVEHYPFMFEEERVPDKICIHMMKYLTGKDLVEYSMTNIKQVIYNLPDVDKFRRQAIAARDLEYLKSIFDKRLSGDAGDSFHDLAREMLRCYYSTRD